MKTGWKQLLYDLEGIRHLLPEGGGEHCGSPADTGRRCKQLDEFLGAPGQYPGRQPAQDRRWLCPGRPVRYLLGPALYRLKTQESASPSGGALFCAFRPRRWQRRAGAHILLLNAVLREGGTSMNG